MIPMWTTVVKGAHQGAQATRFQPPAPWATPSRSNLASSSPLLAARATAWGAPGARLLLSPLPFLFFSLELGQEDLLEDVEKRRKESERWKMKDLCFRPQNGPCLLPRPKVAFVFPILLSNINMCCPFLLVRELAKWFPLILYKHQFLLFILVNRDAKIFLVFLFIILTYICIYKVGIIQ